MAMARLLVFLGTIVLAYSLRSGGSGIIILVLLAGTACFLALLLRYNRLQRKKQYQETAIQCGKNELKALDYDFSAFDGAPEKLNPLHLFSTDLDIFGNHSLFQSMNRTGTNYGKQVLIEWFENPLRKVADIAVRQEAVKELSRKQNFIHHFQILGLINPCKSSDDKEIEDFVKHSDGIGSRKKWKAAQIALPLLWAVLILLTVCAVFPPKGLIGMYLLALLISESQAKKINRLQKTVCRKVDLLQNYLELIQAVECESFQSKRLNELQSVFLQDKRKASADLKKLAQLTSELEQRGNMLVFLLLNPLLLWDIQKSIQLEEWKDKRGKNLLHWIKIMGEFDAYCSLGIFVFNHPDYAFPECTDTYFRMEGRRLGHPLMKQCVRNDVFIEKAPLFLVVTGANMAGKSTYLRTVGVNFVLACIGSSVCAESLTFSPALLITSLRTSDSLNDHESYFFAELKRLKVIIDRLQAGEKVFIILDEILKGTNSVDKQKGSLALVQQFISLQTCGIIATHDLLLGSLEKEFPGKVRNYCFEADIQGDELSFSYQLREGIAQNMNATFLMKKMGITV